MLNSAFLRKQIAFASLVVACMGVVVRADESIAELTATINQQLRSRWEADGIAPATVCSDASFVRRVYLDLAGRIPTLVERDTFLADPTENKRASLIHRLLVSEDHVQHLADTFDALLMGRGDDQAYRQRQEHHWRAWLERVFRENRAWNIVVEELLLARPSGPDDEGAVWYLYERKDNPQAIAEAVAPAFFGIRIDCAQCHDHMIATEIEQQHYWGLVAFFSRSKNETTKAGPRVAESAIGGFSEFANLEGSSSPNVLTFFEAKTIDESRPGKDVKEEDRDDLYLPAPVDGEPRIPKFSRREKFVQEIVHNHPLIARAFVNRVWAMLMGRGLVHPYDQMDSVHQASHPDLLNALSNDFRDSGYDIRRLIQAIVSCDAYQLESRRPDGVDDPATFAWYLQRPLTAEQLARSIQLGLRGRFENQHQLVVQLREKVPAVMPETIVTAVNEPLFLTNGPFINQFIAESNNPEHRLSQLAGLESESEAAEQLSLVLFGRSLDAEEAVATSNFLRGSRLPESGTSRVDLIRLRHVAWAWITSAEFRFNH